MQRTAYLIATVLKNSKNSISEIRIGIYSEKELSIADASSLFKEVVIMEMDGNTFDEARNKLLSLIKFNI